MALDSAAAQQVMGRLTEHLNAHRYSVMIVFGVTGDMASFGVLRKCLRRIKYTAVFMPGSPAEQGRGIVAAVASEQARVNGFERIHTCAMAVRVQFKGEPEKGLVGMHTSQGEDEPTAAAADAWLAQHNGGLLAGFLASQPVADWIMPHTAHGDVLACVEAPISFCKDLVDHCATADEAQVAVPEGSRLRRWLGAK